MSQVASSLPAKAPRVLLPALPSAILLYLCFFPVAWGWLGWVALAPLLGLVRSPARPLRVYGTAYLVGLAFYLPILQWMRVADPRMYFTWIFLAFWCSLFFPVGIAFVRLIERRTGLPLIFTLPVVWTALEFFRCTFGSGFSWYLLGHTQHDFLEMIQISDITGAYGLSFLAVMVNALLFEALWGRRWFRSLWGMADALPRCSRFALLMQALVVLPLIGMTLFYGNWRMRQAEFTPGPMVALLQSNLPQGVRNEPGEAQRVAKHNIALCDLAARVDPARMSLIVWPETSYPAFFEDIDIALSEDEVTKAWRDKHRESVLFAKEVADRKWGNVLIGLNANIFERQGGERQYNSALLIDPQGRIAGRYDKIHRVPLGEYVPLRDILPFMDKLAPYDFDYGVAVGRRYTRLQIETPSHKTYSFGVVICYEDTDPEVSRHYGAGLAGTDFLVNISNDGWFKGTSEHEQHLAICRFRAIECRCPVARSVNMGVSAVIDGNGRVLQAEPVDYAQDAPFMAWRDKVAIEQFDGIAPQVWVVPANTVSLPVGRWHEFKKVPGVLVATLPLDRRESFYATNGDWLPWSCWVALATMLGLAWGRKRSL